MSSNKRSDGTMDPDALRALDKKEMEELAERLKEKELAMQNRHKNPTKASAAAGREVQFKNDDDKRDATEHLRLQARRAYLEKREGQQIDLKKRVLDDAEWVLKNENLSAAEKEAEAALATMSSFIMMAAPVRESFSTHTRKIARAGSRCTKGM